MKLKIIFLILLSFGVLGWLLWRVISNRISLPCPYWLGWMIEMDNPFTKINRSENIIANLKIQQGMMILDAGCGPGRLTIPLAQEIGAQGKIVALDLQEEMLNRVKEKAKAAGLGNIIYLHAGIGEKTLGNNLYDRVILITVLGEIPQQKEALQEIFNTLKPTGLLSITETIFDPHYQRIKHVLSLAYEVGFCKKNLISDLFSYNLLLEKPQ